MKFLMKKKKKKRNKNEHNIIYITYNKQISIKKQYYNFHQILNIHLACSADLSKCIHQN